MNNYDAVLVFDRPLKINDKMVYGYLYDSVFCSASSFDEDEYISYLVGADKWQAHSNTINPDKSWTDTSTNKTYPSNSSYVRGYCNRACLDNPLRYFFKERIVLNYEEEYLDGWFIVSEKFWRESLDMILELNIAEREQMKVAENEDDDLPF